jgi:hypothetical protein
MSITFLFREALDCRRSGTERAGATGGTLESGYYLRVTAMRKFDKRGVSNSTETSYSLLFASRQVIFNFGGMV